MFRFAWKNLWSRPVRSLLALCGLTVAIAGMVGLFSVAEGIEDTITSTFGKVPGLTIMQPGAPIPLFSRLPARWADEIRAVDGVHAVHPEVWVRAHVIDGKPTVSPPRFLFGSDLREAGKLSYSVYRAGLKPGGRMLDETDRGTLNVLVSQAIADEFHKQIGDPLRVDGRDCKIVGVYECQSMFLDVAIILDIDEVRRLGRIGADSVCNFYVEPLPRADRDDLARRLRAIFRGREPDAWTPTLALAAELPAEKPADKLVQSLASALGTMLQTPDTSADRTPSDAAASEIPASSVTPGSHELPVEVRSPSDWAGEFKRFTADLDLFLTLMTGIGVTIAFVGIVNTMLMSVTERFIEFGILKANGWTSGDVLRLIGSESALLGLGGGVAGSAVGWVATQVINARWPTRIHLYASPKLLLFSLCFSVVLGILGGLYPALRAARMMPMEAIRRG
ncbi:MAG: ABC transporter permease [Planctomycetaceae bacterium]